VDVASNVFKTKVIALCATEKRADEMRDFGAWSGLTYSHEHLVAKVKEVTEGNGVDVVFDAVGGPVFDTALQWYVKP
jgi:NADPH2:quinone reductase